jgi:hypothetical protein
MQLYTNGVAFFMALSSFGTVVFSFSIIDVIIYIDGSPSYGKIEIGIMTLQLIFWLRN